MVPLLVKELPAVKVPLLTVIAAAVIVDGAVKLPAVIVNVPLKVSAVVLPLTLRA
jgi:hypothetical protein